MGHDLGDVDQHVVAQPPGDVLRPLVDPRLALEQHDVAEQEEREAADERERQQRRELEAEVAGRQAVEAEARREVGDRGDRPQQEVPDRAGDLRQHAPAGAVVALVDPVAHLRARLRAAPQVDQGDDPGDQRDQRAEREQAARDVGRELVDRAPEHEAEHAERDRPQPGGEHVVGQEAAPRHPAGAGDERHQRADEAEEAADDDHHRAVLGRAASRPGPGARR